MSKEMPMAQNSEQHFDKMTVKELRELAKEIPGIVGISSMKKGELIAALMGNTGDSPAEKKTKNTVQKKPKKVGESMKNLSSTQVKELIASTRNKKETAHEEQDKKMISILRRKLNRLKKQSRKKSTAQSAKAESTK